MFLEISNKPNLLFKNAYRHSIIRSAVFYSHRRRTLLVWSTRPRLAKYDFLIVLTRQLEIVLAPGYSFTVAAHCGALQCRSSACGRSRATLTTLNLKVRRLPASLRAIL